MFSGINLPNHYHLNFSLLHLQRRKYPELNLAKIKQEWSWLIDPPKDPALHHAVANKCMEFNCMILYILFARLLVSYQSSLSAISMHEMRWEWLLVYTRNWGGEGLLLINTSSWIEIYSNRWDLYQTFWGSISNHLCPDVECWFLIWLFMAGSFLLQTWIVDDQLLVGRCKYSCFVCVGMSTADCCSNLVLFLSLNLSCFNPRIVHLHFHPSMNSSFFMAS